MSQPRFFSLVLLLSLLGGIFTFVLDAQAQITLDVDDTCAAPGSSGIIVPVTMANSTTVNEVTTAVIHLSSTELTLTGAACTSRDPDYTCTANQVGQDVTISATPGTTPISGSSGAFLELTFTDDGGNCTPSSTVTMNFTSASLLDGSNNPTPPPTLDGGTFTCGCPTTTTSTIATTSTTLATTTSTTLVSTTSTTLVSTTSTTLVSTTSTTLLTTTSTTELTTTSTSTSTTTTTSSTSSTLVDLPPDCQGIQSDCYSAFEGVQIGSPQRGFGCMNWSEADKCFFVDRNCNYTFEPANGEVLMCGAGILCTALGEACMSSVECCSGTCAGGICTLPCNCDLCIRVGEPCTTDAECCTGLCDGGLCVRCLDITQPCTQNQECCTGQCVAGECAPAGGSASTTSTSLATTTTMTSITTTTVTTTSTSTTLGFVPFAQGDCFSALGLRAEADDLFPWIAPGPETVTGVACHCEGACTSPRATLQLIDGAGNVISTISTLTCGVLTGDSTYVGTDSMDTDRNLVEGERLGFRVTNTPASNDKVTICVTF